uniref:Zinc transporter ZIP3 n=1 Tax=Heterorhabditis bacteriophora TaxID=37862 RepID=A0A1I7XDW3_HETBA
MSITVVKCILLSIMALVTLVFGLAPIKVLSTLQYGSSGLNAYASLVISLLSCFAGGVFLGVCFLDLMPDALEDEVYRVRAATYLTNGQAELGSVNRKEKETGKSVVKSITLVMALLFHASLEGFAFGVQAISSLFFGIIVHKAVVSFSVGMRLVQAHPDRFWLVFILILTIALIAPFGGAIGIIVEGSKINMVTKNIVTCVLLCIALGTFIYLTFMEIIAPEHSNRHSKIAQWCASFLGFAVIAGMMAFGD